MNPSAVPVRSVRSVCRSGIVLAFLLAFCVEPAYAEARLLVFFLFVGNTSYADHRCQGPDVVPGADFTATTLADFHRKHRYNRQEPQIGPLIEAVPPARTGGAAVPALGRAPVNRTLELTVAELDCADEAQHIQGALSRLPGVSGVQTAVGARTVIVAYEPERATPEAIRAAIRGLGMTVTEAGPPASRRRRPLADLLGWGFVSVVAVVALVGIAGERL